MRTPAESLYPSYPHDDHDGSALAFDDTFGSLLEDISLGFDLKARRRVGAKGPVNFWHPGIIIRGVVDHKIESADALDDIPSFVSEATLVAAALQDCRLSPEAFATFRSHVDAIPGLNERAISQPADPVTASSSSPHLAKKAADRLQTYLDSEDMLLIALGHGSYTPAILAHQEYWYARRAVDQSCIYPVRFSLHKLGDTQPVLAPSEMLHLQRLGQQLKHIVIYDEDVSTGHTLLQATRFFDDLLERDTIPATPQGKSFAGDTAIGRSAINEVVDYMRSEYTVQ